MTTIDGETTRSSSQNEVPSTMEMGTPPNAGQDWSVCPSVEDWGRPCGPPAASSVTDERGSPYTIPPTPALYMDSQGRPRSITLSRLSTDYHPENAGMLSYMPGVALT